MKLFTFLMAVFFSFAAQASYSVVSTSTTTKDSGTFTRVEKVIQDGSDSQNRFTETCVYKTSPSRSPRAALVLLPGSSANFELYEPTNSTYANSFVGYYASNDYYVCGYSPRSKQFAENSCDTEDCSIMLGWGLATIASDADYIRDDIVANLGLSVVLVGWSMGGMAGLATLDAYPSDFDAAVIWEGTLYTTDSAVILGNTANCAIDNAKLALGDATNIGLFLTGTSTTPTLKTVANTLTDPLRKLTLVVATTTPLPTPPSYVRNYTFLKGNGSLLAPNWSYADYALVLKVIQQSFNPYEAGAVNRDIHCSLSGDDTSFIDNLGSYTNPVYAVETGHGIGPFMDDSLDLLGTPSVDITYNIKSDFGHGDHYVGTNHVNDLFSPLKTWLNNLFP